VTALEVAGDTTGEMLLEPFDTRKEQLLALSAAFEQVGGTDTNAEPPCLVTDREG
jgi:hypothetical protein